MSDPKPPGHFYGTELRIGYEQSNHALEWPDASGDCGPVDCFGFERHGRTEIRCMVRDMAGNVLFCLED